MNGIQSHIRIGRRLEQNPAKSLLVYRMVRLQKSQVQVATSQRCFNHTEKINRMRRVRYI
jgi:hypothetical protein